MSENNRNFSNEAMEKIIGNMTAEMKNIDGQYVPLGFSTPTTTTTETLSWNQQTNFINHFHADPIVGMEHYAAPQQSFSYIQPTSHIYETNGYKKNLSDYEMYKSMQNGVADMGLYDKDYRILLQNSQMMQNQVPDHIHESMPQNSNRTQLIEHLVGNWMVPNNSGTYSPFGNSESFKPNVFDLQTERDVNIHLPKDDSKFKATEDEVQFQFNRDLRKPRMVAEVKPMRPSYSDVLTKPVPQTNSVKPLKNDSKETKPKKDAKKGSKTEKEKKTNSMLNRSNTNNDIKEVPLDKSMSAVKTEKTKNSKNGNLSRKWASLDNLADNVQKVDDSKKKKQEENSSTKSSIKPQTSKKLNKTVNDIIDLELDNSKSENLYITKNGVKKVTKPTVRPKSNDSFGNNDRPPGKRNQRTRKKENHVPFGIVGQKLKQYTKGWWKIFTVFILWLFHLISDICSLSLHISRDMAVNSWLWLCLHWSMFRDSANALIKKIRVFSWINDKFKGRKKPDAPEENPNFVHNGLQHNLTMPTTGEEAMKRLLACKGKDPYSILGVTPTCTDDDIKRYYKRQAFLVHPDKNNQPGAEEAFKILVHAFDMIGEPERRASYDRGVVESAQVVQAWTELTQLLNQLQQKVEAAANTIRCSACGLRHKRVKIDRPSYAARNCNTCKIHHSAREGDIWAEAKVFGFLWHYYACMEGAVYDITEWAGCQKDSLKHLRPDAHHVQYRIALGKQNNQPKRHMQPPPSDRPDLENLLNSLYSQSENPGQNSRRRHKKGNK